MPKVYNKNIDKDIPKDAVNIMRPSKWGNPFVIGKDGTRADVCRMYRITVKRTLGFEEMIRRELKGKDLVCCCKPAMCHGDYLLEVANGEEKTETERLIASYKTLGT